jgi:NAD(P)-dependent dehydrogenase (short-subunit alcohol dehydrogenase family)
MAKAFAPRQGFLSLASSAAAGAATGFLAVRRWLGGTSFEGQTVLITGGSRGLGLVLAREFLRVGARVAVCARDEAELERARAELSRGGGRVLAVPCDVTDRGQAEAMLEVVEGQLGPVDVLVNNAGIITVGPLETMTQDDFEQAMGTHFWAPLWLTQAVLPGMRERKRGHIVNISSIGGRVSVPHMLPYCASKYALVGLSRGLRAELSADGVQVTTVTPGLMRTGSPPNAFFDGDAAAEYAWFLLSDSLPGLSLPAERAARRILQAAALGKAEASLGVVPWAQMLLYNLAPGLAARATALAARAMPQPPGGPKGRTGRHAGHELPVPRWVDALSVLTRRASLRNNEVPAPSTT